MAEQVPSFWKYMVLGKNGYVMKKDAPAEAKKAYRKWKSGDDREISKPKKKTTKRK